MESAFHKGMSFGEIVDAVKRLGKKGLLTASIIMNIVLMFNLNQAQKATLENIAKVEQAVEEKKSCKFNKETGEWEKDPEAWTEVANDAIATVYNALPSQCNGDVSHTASMFTLNRSNVLSQRVIAMERTFKAELGLEWGDIVYIEGTGKWDGPWRVEDTMNKRFAGMHKIDILVPNNIKDGLWKGVKIFRPKTAEFEEQARSYMAPSL